MSLSHHGAHPGGAHPGPHQDLALSPGQPSGLLLGLPVAPPALTVHFYAAAKVTLLGHKIKHPAEAGVAALPSQVPIWILLSQPAVQSGVHSCLIRKVEGEKPTGPWHCLALRWGQRSILIRHQECGGGSSLWALPVSPLHPRVQLRGGLPMLFPSPSTPLSFPNKKNCKGI